MNMVPLRPGSPVRHVPRLRALTVARAEALTPRMRRITFTGPDLHDFVSLAPDDHVKLFFAAPGAGRSVLPPIGRDYTPRRFDAARGELVIEFVLHGDGPAAGWAAAARPGDPLAVGGPRGSRPFPADIDTFLFIGDETALPSIARAIEELPTGARATALIEIAGRSEEQHLPTAAEVDLRFLHRDGPAGRSDLLLRTLADLPLPRGAVFATVAAELDIARRLRRHLVDEEAIPRERVRAAGYWRLGAENGGSRLPDDG